MAIGEYVDDGNPDGSVLGRSSGKIGFFGLSTPIVKPTATMVGASNTTVAASVAANVDALGTALHSLGLITFTRA